MTPTRLSQPPWPRAPPHCDRWRDQFYGDRSGQFEDPWGHRWGVATHIEDVDDEGNGPPGGRDDEAGMSTSAKRLTALTVGYTY